ncbi:hypothetical protein F4677DRAFT_71985 [Hypoxylon crocopeplum]|nr:hypothetical protein F4677DRAFT_71985 [Hypoxylon crocopeplum]
MDASTNNKFSDMATFGFELEFLVLCKESRVTSPLQLREGDGRIPEEPRGLIDDSDDPHTAHMKRVHHFGAMIAEKITEAGIVTAYREKGHPNDDEMPDLKEEEPRLGEFDGFCYSCYKRSTIVPEETMIWTDPAAPAKRMAVRPKTPEGHFWLGFEFVSKVYRHRDFESTKSDLEVTCRVLRATYLTSVNAGIDSASASSRCATHIHWGLSGVEYDLVTVKRVLTLMWVVEETLMDLHAAWRRDAGKYAALLQKGTNMATDNTPKLPGWVDDLGKGDWLYEMEQNVPLDVHSSLHRNRPKIQWLWRAETVNDLAMLVGEANKSRRASVGITELLPAASHFAGKVRRSQLNTIEFRHMQGSLHPALIAAWVDVTAGIIRQCVDLSPKEFRSSLMDMTTCVSNKNSTVQELLDKLGVVPDTCSTVRHLNQQQLDLGADTSISTFLSVLEGALLESGME